LEERADCEFHGAHNQIESSKGSCNLIEKGGKEGRQKRSSCPSANWNRRGNSRKEILEFTWKCKERP
jgi:hypothetical protein